MTGATSTEAKEHASKRRKLSPSPPAASWPQQQPTKRRKAPQEDSNNTGQIEGAVMSTLNTPDADSNTQLDREAAVGILHYVSPAASGFSGILKQRYTDFLVNEIGPEGNVFHLTDISPPKIETANTSALQDDVKLPQPVPTLAEALELNNKQQADFFDTSSNLSNNGGAPLNPDAAESSEAKVGQLSISVDDQALLESYFGSKTAGEVVKLYQRILDKPVKKAATLGSVISEPIQDRSVRIEMHKTVRRIFNSQLETSAGADGSVKISASQQNGRQSRSHGRNQAQQKGVKGKLGWDELGGEYLHFSLYKENKDTMEALAFVASKLQMKPRSFAFAGTKDKRGVTVQRVSVYRVRADRLAYLNKILLGSRLGNFKYDHRGLELGELSGNEFHITLRDCNFSGDSSVELHDKIEFARKVVREAIENLRKRGFLNYYGLQRFGTFSTGTDAVGMQILQGKYEAAVASILSVNEDALDAALHPSNIGTDRLINKDDISRAHSIWIFETTHNAKAALDKLPRRFSAETSLIHHLKGNKKGADYQGALLAINRNLRLMYVHAYQSRVWNMAASERWTRFGDTVVKGDLVLIDKSAPKANNRSSANDEVDQNGEIIIHAAASDTAVSLDDVFQRARPLTAEEAASGKWSVSDIVLPTPGYDIVYPDNEIGQYYKDYMGSERGGHLDPTNMRRKQKDFSLSGSYRKLFGQVGSDVEFEVRSYVDVNTKIVETDLDRLLIAEQATQGEPREPRPATDPNTTADANEVAARQSIALISPPNPIVATANDDKYATDKPIAGTMPPPPVAAGHSNSKVPATPDSKAPVSGASYQHLTSTSSSDQSDGGVSLTPPYVRPSQKRVAAEAFAPSSVEKPGPVAEAINENKVEKPKIAVIVKFQLASSQYATMALRELMKEGIKTFKPEFSSGR